MAKQNHREKSSNRPADEHHLIKLEKQAGCRDRPQPAWANRKSQRRREFLALGLILGLAGCASVGVRHPTQGAANPRSPSQIFVAEFDAGKGIFQVNRSGDELVAFEQKTAGALADHLVADLSKCRATITKRKKAEDPRGPVSGRV